MPSAKKISQEIPNTVSLGDVDLAALCKKGASANGEVIFLPGTSTGFDPWQIFGADGKGDDLRVVRMVASPSGGG